MTYLEIIYLAGYQLSKLLRKGEKEYKGFSFEGSEEMGSALA
jgi:hypothetical protein